MAGGVADEHHPAARARDGASCMVTERTAPRGARDSDALTRCSSPMSCSETHAVVQGERKFPPTAGSARLVDLGYDRCQTPRLHHQRAHGVRR